MLLHKITITGKYIKLDSLLKFANITSTGGEAKDMILSGKVKVNGITCTMRGKKLLEGDQIEANGELIIISTAEGGK